MSLSLSQSVTSHLFVHSWGAFAGRQSFFLSAELLQRRLISFPLLTHERSLLCVADSSFSSYVGHAHVPFFSICTKAKTFSIENGPPRWPCFPKGTLFFGSICAFTHSLRTDVLGWLVQVVVGPRTFSPGISYLVTQLSERPPFGGFRPSPCVSRDSFFYNGGFS